MTGKLTNAQLEILTLFNDDIEEAQLKELKKILLEFQAKALSKMVDEYLSKEGLEPKDLLEEHMRTPYHTKD